MQIEKLTLDQENQVSQYRNKWEEIALTETFDRSRAKESVELTYGSPVPMGTTIAYLNNRSEAEII